MSTVSKLYIWPARSLFLATTPIPLREYTVTSDQLVVCVEGEMRARLPDGSERVWRSALLRAGTKVEMSELDTTTMIGAIIYLNPVGQDHAVLSQYMTESLEETPGSLYTHRHEDHLIEQLRAIREQDMPAHQAAAVLDDLIIPPADKGKILTQFDPRVFKIIWRIKETVRDNISVAELAEEVHLSESRLMKLFKNQIGIPVTKFRLRYRVFVGVVYLVLGYSITEAALAAGFASTAHFSKCFSAMMGIQPSSAFLKPPYVDIIIADDIVKAVAAAQA